MLSTILLVVFAIVALGVWFQGLGNCAVSLINLLLAGLVATNYFEPLAAKLAEAAPQTAFFADFVCLWFLFAIVFTVLRVLCDTFASNQRIVFPKPVEMAGRSVLALAVAYVFVMFTAMSLHAAPLPQSNFSEPTLLGVSADKQWLMLANSLSEGSLSDGRVFDGGRTFISRYQARRIAEESK